MWRFISQKPLQLPSTWSCMQNLTTSLKLIETDKSSFDYRLQCLDEHLKRLTLLKKHPHSRPVFKGGLCQRQITQTIKRTFDPCGKYGSRPSNGTTLGPYIHRHQFKGRVLRPYRKTTPFKGLRQFHEQTLSYLDIQHRSSKRRRIYRVRTSLHFLPHSTMCRT